MRRHNLERLVDVAGRMGLRRALTSGRRVPPLDPQLRRELSGQYEAEFETLERSWGLDLARWKAPRAAAPRRENTAGIPHGGAS
jgi:hypothetical protein